MSDKSDRVIASSRSTKLKPPVSEGVTKAFNKGLARRGQAALPAAVDVKNGRKVRIRPLHLDWIYDKKQFNPQASNVPGKSFESPSGSI